MKIYQICDKNLLKMILLLLLFGWIMSFSTSIGHFNSYSYAIKQAIFIFLGLFAGYVTIHIPMYIIKKISWILFVISIIALIAVFAPEPIGKTVNGSTRWINFVFFKFQPSEMMKLTMILFVAGFLVRQEKDLRKPWLGFVKALSIIFIAAVLLLFETDFGATIIISLTVLIMLFIAGVYLRQLSIVSLGILITVGILAFLNKNRLARLTDFWSTDLWLNNSDKVYQTKQALIGIARGDISGTGIGAGIQKYTALPEPHTDMIFAVIGEELGIIGMLFVILAFAYIINKGFGIAKQALKNNRKYSSYTAFGICSWLSMQIAVNIAMNLALIPPKGFTLPLISYGGSSMVFTIIALAIIIRIDIDNRSKYNPNKKYV